MVNMKRRFFSLLTLVLFCTIINVTNSASQQAENKFPCQLESNNNTLTCESTKATFATFLEYLTTINGTIVQNLNLINCNIPILPTQIFRKYNLTNLIELKIINCNLQNIEEDAFFGLRQMAKLTIQKNHLRSSLKQNQFNDLRQVIDLNLDDNQIENIPDYTFNGLNRLQNLSLQFNNIKILRKDFIQSSVYISRVSLKNSGINFIEPQAFGFISSIQEIDLSENEIFHLHTNAFMGLSEMETLILKNLSIRTIDPKSFVNMHKLKYLDLSDNKIQNISTDAFYGLSNLKTLNLLNNNEIRDISKNSFISLNNLEVLLLPKYCYQQFLKNGFFNGLVELKSLDLSYINLYDIDPAIFNGLENLEMLNISGNHIKSLNYFTFNKLQNLKILDISSNELENVDIELIVCTYNYMLKKIYLKNNPWDCQRLFKFLKHLEQMNIKYDREYYEHPYILCGGNTYKRDQLIVQTIARNIKAICQEIPMGTVTEEKKSTPRLIAPISSSSSSEKPSEFKSNIIIENVKTGPEVESKQYYFQFNYVGAVLVMLVAFGFSFLLYHLIFVSHNNDVVQGYMYSFSGPTTESKLNLVDTNVDTLTNDININ